MKNAGLYSYRLSRKATNQREVAFAEQWNKENSRDKNGLLLEKLLDVAYATGKTSEPRELPERDRVVAATVIQWLGSNVGMDFLCCAIQRSPEAVRYVKTRLSFIK